MFALTRAAGRQLLTDLKYMARKIQISVAKVNPIKPHLTF